MSEELNKKLAEWAGLCFHEWEVVADTAARPYSRCRKCLHCGLKYSTETDEYLLPKCADGEVYFDESLDACFKWLVPKLWICNITLQEGIFWFVEVSIPDVHGEGKHGYGKALDESLALALCLAIEKLIDTEATKDND